MKKRMLINQIRSGFGCIGVDSDYRWTARPEAKSVCVERSDDKDLRSRNIAVSISANKIGGLFGKVSPFCYYSSERGYYSPFMFSVGDAGCCNVTPNVKTTRFMQFHMCIPYEEFRFNNYFSYSNPQRHNAPFNVQGDSLTFSVVF